MPVHEASGLAATRESIKIVFRSTFVETAMFKKKSNLGASVLINPKLCTLNPPKKNMHTSWEQSFQSTARLPMYLFLIPGISPHQNAPLLLQSLATQESLRQVHARIDPIPPGT